MCRIVLLFSAAAAVLGTIEAAEYYGKLIGQLTTQAHAVSGTVYVVDSTTLRITNFNYDGKAPDTFFWVETVSEAGPTSSGVKLPDENQRTTTLGAYSDADVVLTLPTSVQLSSIKWLSVWCRELFVDLGHIKFQANIVAPSPKTIGQFTSRAHGVSSGTVTVLDTRTIRIENLNYDGQGPDPYFLVGEGTTLQSISHNGATKVPDENGSSEKLHAYTSKTVTLVLPKGQSVRALGWMSIYCIQAVVNFGEVFFPANLDVPPYIEKEDEYYGKLIGQLTTKAHGVSGTVYVVGSTRLQIRDFTYDGKAPDTYFWVETVSAAGPTSDGVQLPDEKGRTTAMGAYSDADVVLTLPTSVQLSSIKWLSVWCRQLFVDLGHVQFPASIVAPTPQAIGQFTGRAHGVSSGTVTVLDTRTIRIENLNYDGQGPDPYFLVGKGTTLAEVSHNDATKVPDENGSLEKMHAYTSKTVTLVLPKGQSVRALGWMSIYCIQAVVNFGEVFFPANLDVPPYIEKEVLELKNCEQMHKHLNVAWEVEGDNIIVELTGALEEDSGYMAFGLSASSASSAMVGSDVIVAYYDNDQSKPVTQDYYLQAYSLCSGGTGACPDTSSGGQDNLQLMWSRRADGITTTRVKRKLDTGDAQRDLVYPTDKEVFIVWAMGFLTENLVVTKHNLRLEGNKKINFGRTASRNCPAVEAREEAAVTPWTPNKITAGTTQIFTARIGPTGGKKGYSGITGQTSWGIAWYINDQLIPEMWVQRGIKYIFRVQGGNDPSNSAEYHPFYITSDPKGSYTGKNPSTNPDIKVYAGVKADGQPMANAVGTLCEYTGAPDDPESYATFADYFKKLTLSCANPGAGGLLEWVPTMDTPDLVYYQCWAHSNLGWKIHVVDDINNINGVGPLAVSSRGMLLLLLMVMLLLF